MAGRFDAPGRFSGAAWRARRRRGKARGAVACRRFFLSRDAGRFCRALPAGFAAWRRPVLPRDAGRFCRALPAGFAA
jgi:hypothetical protein